MKRKAGSLVHMTSTIPFFVLVFFFLLLPFCNTIIQSVSDPESRAPTFGNFVTIFSKPIYRTAIWNSVKLALISTSVGLVLSFITALAVTSLPDTERGRFMPILNMTQNFTGFPLAFAFILMVGNAGFIVFIAESMGLHVFDSYNLYSTNGLIPLFIYFTIPLGTLLLIPGFQAVKKEWKEAAVLLRANGFQFWMKVGLPVLAPTLLGTTSMLFADSITTYTTVFMILESNAATLPVKISMMFSGDSKQQTELGSALSLTMIAMILLVMALTNLAKWWIERKRRRA